MTGNNSSTQIVRCMRDFLNLKNTGDILIYNEISLQLELGQYFRTHLDGFKVRFERNISYYSKDNNLDLKDFSKHEIDIVLFKGENEKNPDEIYAIELKFPRKGQHPEQMFSFLKDIEFMEQVKSRIGFTNTFALTLVDDDNFYDKGGSEGIYQYFRKRNCIIPKNLQIDKPTGNKAGKFVKLTHDYQINWENLGANCGWIDEFHPKEDYRFYLIEIP